MRKDAGTHNREGGKASQRNGELILQIVAAEEKSDHERIADLCTLANETGDAELLAIFTEGDGSSTQRLLRAARLVRPESEPAEPASYTREGE